MDWDTLHRHPARCGALFASGGTHEGFSIRYRGAHAAARAGAVAREFRGGCQHAEPEHLLDDRPRGHHDASTAWWPTATRSTPATTARSSAWPSARRRRWTASTCRSSGTPTSRSSAAPSRAPWRRDIYNNKIVAERSYMQASNTRVVTFEMCGNDGLQARSSFTGQTGTCNYAALNTAVTNCTTYIAAAMEAINTNALRDTKAQGRREPLLPGLRRRQRAELLHGLRHRRHGRTSRTCSCRTSPHELLDVQLRARRTASSAPTASPSTWAPTTTPTATARSTPTRCATSQGETEAAYVTRITVDAALDAARRQHALRDVDARSFDYIQSDNTHPTYTGGTVSAGLFGGTAPARARRATRRSPNGKNPVWNQLGHERMGWATVDLQPGDALTAARQVRMDAPRRSASPPSDEAGGGGAWARLSLPCHRARRSSRAGSPSG